jgi:ABC-type phosphate transport system substrate-binding protein
MSALKQKMARLGVRAGLLAGASAAVLAISGVGASSALAACPTTLTGQGSSLQKVAQTEIWSTSFESEKCSEATENAKMKYEATSSGKGLGKWRFTGTGTIDTTVAFVGTDDAPNEGQINNAKEKAGGASVVTVPVAQTAIAIMVHPPEGCSLTKISNAALEEAFSGKATTWAAIGATPAGSCGGSLTRVVRAEGSGTTFQFKAYLAQVNAGAPCAGSPTEWAKLEEIGAEEKPNITWPECGTIKPTTAAGGGGVASKVASTSGTIGYAALPDAKANSATTIKVQDGTEGGVKLFASPGTETGEEANCAKAEYKVPAQALRATGTGIDVKEWATVFGGNPTIGGETYPICTLTYDLGWTSFSKAGFAATTGGFVKRYYEFILSHKLGASHHWYAALPALKGESEVHNVQDAAEFAASKIG